MPLKESGFPFSAITAVANIFRQYNLTPEQRAQLFRHAEGCLRSEKAKRMHAARGKGKGREKGAASKPRKLTSLPSLKAPAALTKLCRVQVSVPTEGPARGKRRGPRVTSLQTTPPTE